VSIAQERLWVLERLHPRNPAHNVTCGLRLAGALDIELFVRAWSEVAQQHEILSTVFQASEGVPRAIGVASSFRRLSLHEVTGISAKEREFSLATLVREEARQPFDLAVAPLLRASLWRLAPSENVLLLVAHRIVCDQSSLEILLGEVALRYEACQNGKAETDAPPMQYSEFVSRRRKVQEEKLLYWKQQLSGAPASVDLPIDRKRPAEQSFSGSSHAFSIGQSDLDSLRILAQSHGITLFETLLAAFNVLLSRYSRQDDLIVGTHVSGRWAPEHENVIGPVENMLALRTDLSGNPSFSDLLSRVREVAAGGFLNQDVPFETLLEELPLDRDLSRNPLFQVAFNFARRLLDHHWPAGISAVRLDIEHGTERFDLSLALTELSDSIQGKLSYNTDIFEAPTITRMVEHFCRLAAGLAADTSRRILEISLLGESERNKILVDFNATARNYRRDVCIHSFFEEQVERSPEATALICEDERVTYRELNSRANQVAHYLRRQGVGPEILVGICTTRSIEMLVGVLGILKAGGAYVPLDPAYPRDRLAAILEDARAPILLTQTSAAKALPGHAARVIRLDADWDDVANEPVGNPDRNVAPSNLGYVLFTSGSTGRPKGVALEHRSAATFIQWAQDLLRSICV
jgi:hypothetical protein